MKRKHKKLISFIVCSMLLLTTLCNNVTYYPMAEGGTETDAGTIDVLSQDQSAGVDDMSGEQPQGSQEPTVTESAAATEPVMTTEQEITESTTESETATDMTEYAADVFYEPPVSAYAADVRELPNSQVQVVTYVNGVETSIADAGVLSNGDRIEVQLSWSIDNTGTPITKDTDMTYDLKATGVTISNTSGSVLQGGKAVGTYNIDSQGVLHIFITDANMLAQSNIRGNVDIQGVINVDGLPEDDNGIVRAEIAGTTIDVKKSEPSGKPTVSKSRSGPVYTGADGKIYQNFEVNVYANGTSDELIFTDRMGNYLSMVNGSFMINGAAATPTVGNGGKEISYTFSPVKAKDAYKITYTAEVSPNAYDRDFGYWVGDTDAYNNTASVRDTYGEDSTTIFSLQNKEWIKKSSQVNANGKITWTITVNDGDVIDISGAVVKDSLPAGLKLDGNVRLLDSNWNQLTAINGHPLSQTAINGVVDGGFTFPEGSCGRYIFQFDTVEENTSFVDSTYTNKATIKDPDYNIDKEAAATATVSHSWLQKRYVSVDETAETITWESVITVPAGQRIENFMYHDTLGEGLSTAGNVSTQIPVSVSVSGTGSSGNMTDGTTATPNISGQTFSLNLGTVTGPVTITLRYTTEYDAQGQPKVTFRNTAKIANPDAEKEVTATYDYEDGSINCLGYKSVSNTDGTRATWSIQVKDADKLRARLEKDPSMRIVITDTVALTKEDGSTPIAGSDAKVELVPNSLRLQWGGDDGRCYVTGRVSDAGARELEFDITEQVRHSWGSFAFEYTLDIDSGGIRYMLDSANNAKTIREKNSATAEMIKGDGTKEDAGEVDGNNDAWLRVGDTLTKGVTYNASTAPNAIYSIDVNPDGYALTSNGGTLELEDVLGANLQLKPSTITLVDKKTGTDITNTVSILYNGTNTLTIAGIPDRTPCVLSYEVYVNVPYDKTKPNETFADKGADVSNACRLFTVDGWENRTDRNLQGTVLKSSATVVSDYGTLIINKYNSETRVLEGVEFTLHAYQLNAGGTAFESVADSAYNAANPPDTSATQMGQAVKTDDKGRLTLQLKYDTLYVITETKALDGYKTCDPMCVVLKGKDYDKLEVAINAWNAANPIIDERLSSEYKNVVNERSSYSVTIFKKDQDGAMMPNVTFRLYHANATNDGKADNTVLKSGKTDRDGKLVFDVDTAGNYWLEEVVPAGYAEMGGQLVTVSAAGGTSSNATVNITNNKLYGSYEVMKQDDGGTPLSGVTFRLYTKNADGNDVLQETKRTGADGKLKFERLEYGVTYYIRETETLPGYILDSNEVTFTPTGSRADDTSLNGTGTFTNTKQNGMIRINKTDAESGDPLAGAEYTLYDRNRVPVTNALDQVITATTDANGVAEFNGLLFGTYYVRETKAPQSGNSSYEYVLDDTYHQVVVDSNTLGTKNTVGHTNKRRVLISPYVSFRFSKQGLDHDKAGGSAGPLAGATFRLYAGDGTGMSLAQIEANLTLRDTQLSDGSGQVCFRNISTGNGNVTVFTLVESSAPAGYYAGGDAPYIRVLTLDELTNQGCAHDVQKTATDSVASLQEGGTDAVVRNYRVIGKISLKKTGTDNTVLEGAVYGLYQTDGTKLEAKASDASGNIVFTTELVYGNTYMVREDTPPHGYALNTKEYIFTVGDEKPSDRDIVCTLDEVNGVYGYSFTAQDEPLALSIGKEALIEGGSPSGTPLAGATLALYDGTKEIERWVSQNTPHVVSAKLEARKQYTLKEISAPAGYGYSGDVVIWIDYSGSVRLLDGTSTNAAVDGTKVIMRDRRINFSLSKVAAESGERIGGAKIQIKRGGTVLYTTTTNANRDIVINAEIASANGITAPQNPGSYEVYSYVEAEAPEGFIKAADIYFCIDHLGQVYTCDSDGNDRVPAANLRMEDERDKSYVFISKGYQADESFRYVRGAKLQLEHWNAAEGKWEMLGGEWLSDYSQKAFAGTTFTDGEKYRLVETEPPFGYALADPIVFIYKAGGPDSDAHIETESGETIEYSHIYMYDEPVTVKVHKRNMEDDRNLSGAVLEITDTAGKRITSWTTDAAPEDVEVRLLKNDTEYILHEVRAPYGYDKADDIRFKISYEIDTVSGEDKYTVSVKNETGAFVEQDALALTMYDDEGKLAISKVDAVGADEIAGAGLTVTDAESGQVIHSWISSADGPEYIPVLDKFVADRIYCLVETTAPYGYEIAEDIFFKIDTENRIWVSDSADGEFVEQHGTQIVMEDAHRQLTISKKDLVGGQEIDDAELVITDTSGNVVVPAWKSSAAAPKKISILDVFEQDVVYTLTETTAPFGYEIAESIDFKIGADGTISYKKHGEPDTAFKTRTDDMLVMNDAPMYIYVSKVDMTNSAEIAGAGLTITELVSGAQVDAWTSEAGVTHSIQVADKLRPNVIYVLKETTAPFGYEIAESILFYMDESGKIYVDVDGAFKVLDGDTIVMEDAPVGSVIHISKQELAGGQEIDGATLVITDESGNTVMEWTSSDVRGPRQIRKSMFEADRTYTLTETNAPDGYAYAESMTFRIDSEGNLYVNGVLADNNRIVMVDELIRVRISKQDITNGKELPGAELVIRNAEGQVIYSFTSGTEPTLIPAEVFVAPKPGEMSYYTLTEITAPDGYELAETIQFAIDSRGVIYVLGVDGQYVTLQSLGADMIVMLDHPTVTAERTLNGPKTGDRAPIIPVVMLAVVSFMGMFVVRRLRRRG